MRRRDEVNFWIVWGTVLLLLTINLLVSCCKAQYKPTPEPKPPIEKYPTISEEIRPIATVQRQGYPTYLFTIFFPEFLYVKEAQLSSEDAIEFWDKVTKTDTCNGTRLFIGHTSWASKYEAWIEKPFLMENDRYILPGLDEPIKDYINPEWERLLLERLRVLRDREIFRSIDLWDYCQMHRRHNTSWDTHWINGRNNTKGTADDPEAVFYYSRPDAGTAWKQTGKYVEKFTRYLVKTIWEEEAKHIRPGWNTSLGFNPGNEVPPSKTWNDRICEIVNEEIQKVTPGVTMYRWQMLGSALPYTQLPLGIDDKCLYQLHHVGSFTDYVNLKSQVIIPRFMASSDGSKKNGKKFLMGKAEAVQLINQIISDENFGLELMYGHRQDDKRLPNASNGWRYNLPVIDLTVPCAVVQTYKDSFQ